MEVIVELVNLIWFHVNVDVEESFSIAARFEDKIEFDSNGGEEEAVVWIIDVAKSLVDRAESVVYLVQQISFIFLLHK